MYECDFGHLECLILIDSIVNEYFNSISITLCRDLDYVQNGNKSTVFLFSVRNYNHPSLSSPLS